MAEATLSIQELEQRQHELMGTLSPFFPYREQKISMGLQKLDRDLFERLVIGTGFQDGQTGACPTTYRFLVETFQSTEKGRKSYLQSDVDLLEKLHREGKDQEHVSAFGTHEGLFPVFVNGDIVWSVWTGKLFREPMSDEFLKILHDITEIPLPTLQSAATNIPTFNAIEIDAVMQAARKTRDILQVALQAEVRNVRLSEQLLQSERLRSLGTLSSGVAHHFNNLLSVILGYSTFVTNREKLSDEATHALRQISDAAQRGRRLTEEVLAFSGSEEEESVVGDMHETLTNVLSLLQSQVSSRIKISKHLSAAKHQVQAPPSVIHQIVFNLLTNSIDSMEAGGNLSVRSDNRVIGGDQTEYISIQLTDTGDGFPRGFDPLQASDEFSTDDTDRDVLKLSSVYGMVERLDGTVTVSTSSAGENTVEVLLPVSADGPVSTDNHIGKKRLTPCVIWVVDDDLIFRQMCRQVLSDDGHDVSEVTSGTELMENWDAIEQKPDLLILDFSMPEYNGLEIRQWLDKKQADIAVLLVSGFASSQPDIREALSFRKTYFLQKPFSVPELADIVAVAMGETLIGE